MHRRHNAPPREVPREAKRLQHLLLLRHKRGRLHRRTLGLIRRTSPSRASNSSLIFQWIRFDQKVTLPG